VASSLAARVERSIAEGVAFLAREQHESGEFSVFLTTPARADADPEADPAIFPTALIAYSLSFCSQAEPMRQRAAAFLLREQDRFGLWRHWPRRHAHRIAIPPDVDDTSCASAALVAAGEQGPANARLLLANRNRDGLFLTWILPRRPVHAALAVGQLARAPFLYRFFRQTSAEPDDVDAVVNANALFYLGTFPGAEKVAAFLINILAEGREQQCDKWYDNRFVIGYFFSRALERVSPGAISLVVERLSGRAPATSLEMALVICTLFCCNLRPSDAIIEALIAEQQADGRWPREPLYHGGRKRRSDGVFAAPDPHTPYWGSEALTTGF
jgi:hypothetical protein